MGRGKNASFGGSQVGIKSQLSHLLVWGLGNSFTFSGPSFLHIKTFLKYPGYCTEPGTKTCNKLQFSDILYLFSDEETS